MGLMPLCVIFLTLLLQRNWVYSTVSCPSGDTSGIVKNGQTCSQLISGANYECYDATIETSCCASCNAIVTVISGCQYGDKVANCIVDLCPFYSDPSECCSICITTPTTASTTTSTTTMTTTTSTTTTTTPATTTTTTTPATTTTMTTPATTTTTTSSPATNIATGSTSQASSSVSTSAGLIAGAVIGSIIGTVLMVGLAYGLVRLFTGTKLRRTVSSSTANEDLIDNNNAENNENNADNDYSKIRQSNSVIPRSYGNGDILEKSKSLPPLETKMTSLPPLPNLILSKPPVFITARS